MARRQVTGSLVVGAVGLLGALAGNAWGQQAPTNPPDYAGVLGVVDLVIRDNATAQRRGLTPAEVKSANDRQQVKRSVRQVRESAYLNRQIAAMPATNRDAEANAKAGPGRAVVIEASREELQPTYGVRDQDGGMTMSHDPVRAKNATR